MIPLTFQWVSLLVLLINIQNNLISLAETSQNFLAVVAPPEGLNTPQEAIDWHNGQSNERTAAITSNFAAIYWPWVEVFDQFAGKDRYYDPAVWAVRQMCVTDDVADPWFAPAGVIRGRLTKPTDVEVSVNQGDRDSMYSGGNVINPIVKFPQQGIMIFGQRTAQRTGSALDRVNVRRMLIIVRKQVLAATRRYVFEPNDATTWEKVQKTLELLLDELKRRRGLVDYKVVCDETTNTPLRVDRNELWAKCILKPTKAAEIVVVELDLRSQSAEL
jgi:phage tail sheath protein FI